MRTTYIKPNSHTQQQARKHVSVVEEVCQKAGIDMDTWLGIMFESGCQYMEMISDDEAFVRKELQDAKYGFWAWWMNFWINDDAKILDYGLRLSGGAYAQRKHILLYDLNDLINEKVQNETKPGAGGGAGVLA